jgi:transcription factor SPN1
MKPSGGSRRRKKDGIDLEGMADAEIEDMRRRMASAAEADNEGRKRGEPARHKLKLLPEVVTMLNKNSIKDSIVDPETNLLEAVRFFLEPLSDGSLPAYDIQKELFAALAKLPITKDSLVASGIGKVIMFYCKSKRPELMIRRQAERLYTDWTRPILRRSDDYRKKEFAQADYDPTYVSRILPLSSTLLMMMQCYPSTRCRSTGQPSRSTSCSSQQGPRSSHNLHARSPRGRPHHVHNRSQEQCRVQREQQSPLR